MIQIRNVPDDVHRKLKIRAAAEGVTLSELLGRAARQLADRPTLGDMIERLRAREPVRTRTPAAAAIRAARDAGR